MFKISKWNILYLVLALLLLFSLIAVPKIAMNALNENKGRIVSVPTDNALSE